MNPTPRAYIIQEFVKGKWYSRIDLNGDGNLGYASLDKAINDAKANCDMSRVVIRGTNEFQWGN